MNDGLNYIREAISKNGDSATVMVVRWEKDFKTGYYSRPFKIEMKADIALRELEKPLNKRSSVWKRVRPVGMSMEGNITTQEHNNRLNNPDLIEQLKAEIRAELAAELAAEMKNEIEKLPKKKRKQTEIIDEVAEDESISDELSDDLNQL